MYLTSQMRQWIEKEFATETPFVLEPPRNTLGAIFIDDLHLIEQKEDDDGTQPFSKRFANRPESLLLGLFDSYPAFGIKRGNLEGKGPIAVEYQPIGMPVMHRTALTDPRDVSPSKEQVDKYLMSHLSIVCAASGSPERLLRVQGIQQLAGKFCLLGLTPLSVLEIHTALINGSLHTLCVPDLNTSLVEIIRTQVLELSRITITIQKQIWLSRSDQYPTSMESNIVRILTFNMQMVSKFCFMIHSARERILESELSREENIFRGGLLQVWLHEWERLCLDPLPPGALHDGMVTLMIKQLSILDLERWGVSHEWLEKREHLLGKRKEIWCPIQTSDNSEQHYYFPLRPSIYKATCTNEGQTLSLESAIGTITKYNPENDDHQKHWLTLASTVHEIQERDLPGLPLTQNGVTNFILLKRALLCSLSSHICVPTYVGQSIKAIIHLGSTTCGKTVRVFKTHHVTEGGVSSDPKVSLMNNFKRFMKMGLLQAAGLMPVDTTEKDFSHNNDGLSYIPVLYTTTEPVDLLLVVEGAQHLDEESRRVLSVLMECNDSSSIFDESEILGISLELRKRVLENSRSSSIYSTTWDDEPYIKVTTEVNVSMESKDAFTAEIPPSQRISNSPGKITGAGSDYESQPKRLKFEGFSYRWVKSFIHDAFRQRIRIILLTDVPKSHVLKRQPEISNKAVLSTVTAHALQETHHGRKSSMRRGSVRYSLVAHNKFNQRNTSDVKQEKISTSKVPVEDLLYVPISKFDGDGPSIFECRIIAPLLQKYFTTIWAGTSEADDINDVTNLELLLNAHTKVGMSSNPITKCFRLSMFTDRVGESQSRAGHVGFDHVVRFSIQCHRPYMHFGLLHEWGIFGSFTPLYITCVEGRYEAQVKQMYHECMELLPELLRAQTPVDAFLSNKPVAFVTPDRMTYIACTIIHSMVRHAGYTFLPRREEILQSLTIAEEALQILDQLDDLQLAVKLNTRQLTDHIELEQERIKIEADQSIVSDGQHGNRSLDLADEIAMLSNQILMVHEDLVVNIVNYEEAAHRIDELVTVSKYALTRVPPQNWMAFSRLFMNKPNDALLLIMRGVLIAINFNPQSRKSYIGGSFPDVASMPRDSLARSAAAILCSPEFLDMVEIFEFRHLDQKTVIGLDNICDEIMELTSEMIHEGMSPVLMNESDEIVHILIDYVSAIDECCTLKDQHTRCRANSEQLSSQFTQLISERTHANETLIEYLHTKKRII